MGKDMQSDVKKPLGAQMSLALKERGVDVIFGIPGVHNVELYRGIEDAGIFHVLARHEQGAGFMADGYARASGKPGVAYVITGPGVCNIMTPMGQAYSDSVPVLVVSSCLERPDRSMRHGLLHEMIDQEAAAGCVCEWSVTAPDANGAYRLIERAFTEFETKRHRSKHIQVSIDVLGALALAADKPLPRPAKPRASSQQVQQVCDMIKGARKPLLIFGGGTRFVATQARLVHERSGAAVFTTYAGAGVVADNHPLSFGTYIGRSGSEAIAATADLVITVGSGLCEGDLWRRHLGHKAPMVRVDIDPAVLCDNHLADVPVLGDAGAFLTELAELLKDHQPQTDWQPTDVALANKGFRADTDAQRSGIAVIVEAMSEVLPDETTIYSDMTQFAYVGIEVFDHKLPNRWHHPTGFGTLGYALPAAIGGKVALGDAPVVALAGDYGFQYTIQELGVAAELNLSLPIVLWDNGKLKEIEDSMVNSQIAPNAVVAQNPDFSKLADAYGIRARKPDSLAEFQEVLRQSLDLPGPTLIHVTTDMSL